VNKKKERVEKNLEEKDGKKILKKKVNEKKKNCEKKREKIVKRSQEYPSGVERATAHEV